MAYGTGMVVLHLGKKIMMNCRFLARQPFDQASKIFKALFSKASVAPHFAALRTASFIRSESNEWRATFFALGVV
jgi:hypothetical protein